MNWKSTVLVSGAGVLATWFASTPPVQHAPAPVEQAAVPTTGVSQQSDEIVREAERLTARLQPPVAYQEPSRNPFRFGARPAPAPRVPRAPEREITDEPMTDAPAGPSLRVNLSGIAEDTAGGTTVRTAVISTQDDLLLVKEGDVIAGQYTVTAITSTTVELTRVADGSVVRLALRP